MGRRLGTLLLALVAAAALSAVAESSGAGRFTLRGTVAYVVDGDTVDVRLGTGGLERIRLIGIDTPERGDCDATAATRYARRLALGRRVVLRGDATQATRDRYGRLLAYVWLPGGVDLGYRQLARGYARVYVYERPFARVGAYRRAETLGRRRADGIWRGCVTTPPPPRGNCDPSYPDVCIPPPPPDLDCADVPYKSFHVVGADPHRFDGDRDGTGCER